MKTILVIKKMPKSCKNCPLMFESDDGQWCGYERTEKNELHMRVHYYVGDRTKPSWCNLRPLEENYISIDWLKNNIPFQNEEDRNILLSMLEVWRKKNESNINS